MKKKYSIPEINIEPFMEELILTTSSPELPNATYMGASITSETLKSQKTIED